MDNHDQKTVYLQDIEHIIIPDRNTKEEVIKILDQLKDNLEFIKELFDILPEVKLNKFFI